MRFQVAYSMDNLVKKFESFMKFGMVSNVSDSSNELDSSIGEIIDVTKPKDIKKLLEPLKVFYNLEFIDDQIDLKELNFTDLTNGYELLNFTNQKLEDIIKSRYGGIVPKTIPDIIWHELGVYNLMDKVDKNDFEEEINEDYKKCFYERHAFFEQNMNFSEFPQEVEIERYESIPSNSIYNDEEEKVPIVPYKTQDSSDKDRYSLYLGMKDPSSSYKNLDCIYNYINNRNMNFQLMEENRIHGEKLKCNDSSDMVAENHFFREYNKKKLKHTTLISSLDDYRFFNTAITINWEGKISIDESEKYAPEDIFKYLSYQGQEGNSNELQINSSKVIPKGLFLDEKYNEVYSNPINSFVLSNNNKISRSSNYNSSSENDVDFMVPEQFQNYINDRNNIDSSCTKFISNLSSFKNTKDEVYEELRTHKKTESKNLPWEFSDVKEFQNGVLMKMPEVSFLKIDRNILDANNNNPTFNFVMKSYRELFSKNENVPYLPNKIFPLYDKVDPITGKIKNYFGIYLDPKNKVFEQEESKLFTKSYDEDFEFSSSDSFSSSIYSTFQENYLDPTCNLSRSDEYIGLMKILEKTKYNYFHQSEEFLRNSKLLNSLVLEGFHTIFEIIENFLSLVLSKSTLDSNKNFFKDSCKDFYISIDNKLKIIKLNINNQFRPIEIFFDRFCRSYKNIFQLEINLFDENMNFILKGENPFLSPHRPHYADIVKKINDRSISSVFVTQFENIKNYLNSWCRDSSISNPSDLISELEKLSDSKFDINFINLYGIFQPLEKYLVNRDTSCSINKPGKFCKLARLFDEYRYNFLLTKYWLNIFENLQLISKNLYENSQNENYNQNAVLYQFRSNYETLKVNFTDIKDLYCLDVDDTIKIFKHEMKVFAVFAQGRYIYKYFIDLRNLLVKMNKRFPFTIDKYAKYEMNLLIDEYNNLCTTFNHSKMITLQQLDLIAINDIMKKNSKIVCHDLPFKDNVEFLTNLSLFSSPTSNDYLY